MAMSIEMKGGSYLLLAIVEKIVNGRETDRNKIRENTRKWTDHCWTMYPTTIQIFLNHLSSLLITV